MSVVRRFISIVVLASLPFATNASFAHTFPIDPSAPSTLKTPPTGTGFGTAARNQMFLTDIFEGYNIANGFYTTPSTPWVNGQDVIVSEIPFGHPEKSAIERIRSQAGADAGMSLNCCVPLELEFFEVPICGRGSVLELAI